MSAESEQPRFKRSIGLFDATVFGVSIILGAGIYALIGSVIGISGNASWMAFVLAAIISVLTGLSYAELSTTTPKAGAEFFFTRKTFKNPLFSFLVGWILIISSLFGVTTVAIGFANYFVGLIGLSYEITTVIIIAIILILLLSIINFVGIWESAKINNILTVIEVSGIVLIIILGFSNIGNVSVDFLEFPVGTTNIFLALINTTVLIFFAFIGFESLVSISEETKRPTRTIPLAIIISIIITAILYILMAFAVVLSGVPNLQDYPNALATIAEAFLGPTGSIIMTCIALFATANTVLFLLIAVSRQFYGMGSVKALPGRLAKIHYKTQTPYVAIIVSMLAAMGFSLLGDIEVVAKASVLTIIVVYFIINVGVIYLRKSQPDLPRPFKVRPSIKWLPIIPLFGVATCFLLFFSFFEDWLTPLILITVIVIGLGFYFLFNHRVKPIPDQFTTWLEAQGVKPEKFWKCSLSYTTRAGKVKTLAARTILYRVITEGALAKRRGNFFQAQQYKTRFQELVYFIIEKVKRKG
jgi:APA family basic amino acid/polyamine antiporter